MINNEEITNGSPFTNDATYVHQLNDKIMQLEEYLAAERAAKDDLAKHLQTERAELTKVTHNNQELQEKLQKRYSEVSILESSNRAMQRELKNVFADNADLSLRNRLLSAELQKETCISIGTNNLELEKHLTFKQEDKMKILLSKNREMSMELAFLQDELKESEQNAKQRMKDEVDIQTRALEFKHQKEINAMQLAFEEEQVRAGINSAADIKVVQLRAKLSFNETQELSVKVKSLEASLAQSKGEAQTLIGALKNSENDLAKAKQEIHTINDAKDLLQREFIKMEKKQMHDWKEYEKQRNQDLLTIKQEVGQIREMSKSKFSIKKRPSTRRELIQRICTQLEVRVGASLE